MAGARALGGSRCKGIAPATSSGGLNGPLRRRCCACFLRGFAQLRVLVALGVVAEVTVATALNCSLRRRLGQPFGRTLRAVAHLWLGTLLERWSGPRRLWPGRPTTITTPCCCSPDLPGRPRRRPETYDRSRRLCSVHARKCRHFTSLP